MLYDPDFDNYWKDNVIQLITECERCEEVKLCVNTTCPYEVEIYEDFTLVWICAECHWNRSQDI